VSLTENEGRAFILAVIGNNSSGVFDEDDFMRLVIYRRAVTDGFYNDGFLNGIIIRQVAKRTR